MFKKLTHILFTIILLSLLQFACEAPKSYPETPEISFKSLTIKDNIDTENPDNSKKEITLTLSVIDGDGDIGILGDNNYIYPGFEDLKNANLFITLYEKKDGKFMAATPWNYGTPYLSKEEGQDKTLKADIEVSMEIPFQFYTYDTIQYRFYIYDRDKHKSNIGKTPEIPADTLGTVKVR